MAESSWIRALHPKMDANCKWVKFAPHQQFAVVGPLFVQAHVQGPIRRTIGCSSIERGDDALVLDQPAAPEAHRAY
jgi:hypothetical protein